MDSLSTLTGAGLTMVVLFVVWRGRYAKDELDHLKISSFSILALLAGGLACSTRSSGSLAIYVAGATAGAFIFYTIAFGFAIRRWRRKAQQRGFYNITDYGASGDGTIVGDGIHDDTLGIQRAGKIVTIGGTRGKSKGGRR